MVFGLGAGGRKAMTGPRSPRGNGEPDRFRIGERVPRLLPLPLLQELDGQRGNPLLGPDHATARGCYFAHSEPTSAERRFIPCACDSRPSQVNRTPPHAQRIRCRTRTRCGGAPTHALAVRSLWAHLLSRTPLACIVIGAGAPTRERPDSRRGAPCGRTLPSSTPAKELGRVSSRRRDECIERRLAPGSHPRVPRWRQSDDESAGRTDVEQCLTWRLPHHCSRPVLAIESLLRPSNTGDQPFAGNSELIMSVVQSQAPSSCFRSSPM